MGRRFRRRLGTISVASVLVLMSSLVLIAPRPAFAYTGQKLAGQATISLHQARRIALRAHPGKITDQELERESGGSGLRYSFDIRRGKVTREVGIDATTGRVLENAREAKNPD